MTLKDLRNRFPEYRDLTDAELLEEVHESSYSDIDWEDFLDSVIDQPVKDTVTPAIEQLTQIVSQLVTTIKTSENNNYQKILLDIDKSIKALAKQMKDVEPPVVNIQPPTVKVDAPVVNLPAPVVNVEAPIVNVTEREAAPIVITKPKEWDFKIHRDRNGFIQNVTATEVLNVKK